MQDLNTIMTMFVSVLSALGVKELLMAWLNKRKSKTETEADYHEIYIKQILWLEQRVENLQKQLDEANTRINSMQDDLNRYHQYVGGLKQIKG